MSRLHEIVIPQLGVNETEGVLVCWLAEAGQHVVRGQIIAQVETSKAVFDVEADDEGYFYALVESGSRISFHSPAALLLDAPDAAAVEVYLASKQPQMGAGGGNVLEPGETRQFTAKARELFQRNAVDLDRLPVGRIIRESDILSLLRQDGRTEQSAAPVHPVPQPAVQPHVRTVVVYGASQGGVAIVECLRSTGTLEAVAFLDDAPGMPGTEYHGLPVWSGSELESLRERGVDAVASHIMAARVRYDLRDRADRAGLVYLNAIHARAIVAPTVTMGVGNVIKAGAILDACVEIGDCCIIDNGVVLPHHNKIGSGCHLAPGACFGGNCEVGDNTVIGIGAVVSARTRIGANVIIGVGACVARNIPDNAVVEGHSGRIAGQRRPV